MYVTRIRVASQTRPPTIRTEATLLMNESTRPLVVFDSQWLALHAALCAILRESVTVCISVTAPCKLSIGLTRFVTTD